jgi:hypothetical protein
MTKLWERCALPLQLAEFFLVSSPGSWTSVVNYQHRKLEKTLPTRSLYLSLIFTDYPTLTVTELRFFLNSLSYPTIETGSLVLVIWSNEINANSSLLRFNSSVWRESYNIIPLFLAIFFIMEGLSRFAFLMSLIQHRQVGSNPSGVLRKI